MVREGKGAMFTMEAFLATMIVLAAIFFLYLDPIDLPTFQEDEIKRRARDCLNDLHLEGKLQEEENLEENVGECLPPGLDYTVVTCDSSGCEEPELPEDKSVLSSSYFITGEGESFPKQVIIYGWAE
ncbi:MAG: hypothetical protein ACLFM9_04280 [Candidatus Aenigmatarchaeota archaeon]